MPPSIRRKKNRLFRLHPIAQALAAGIIPRDAALMDFSAGGLTNDQQAGGRCGADHRAGTVWKMGRAYLASPDVAQDLL